MDLFNEINYWMKEEEEKGKVDIPLVETLPTPNFKMAEKDFTSFSTNNYLCMAKDPRLIKIAKDGIDQYGVANCESRLLGGDLKIYRELEAKVAQSKKKQDCITYATGLLTNMGALSTLVHASELLELYGLRTSKNYKFAYFSDEYNHISIREGIRSSNAQRFIYRHCDLQHLEGLLKRSNAEMKIIVTDGVFSMDGDIAPIPELLKLAIQYQTYIYIDDAHGTGVLGETGAGICEHFNCYHDRIIHMGTFSKAIGAIGGFIAANGEITQILRYCSSAYGFTSAITPDMASVIIASMDIIAKEPERRNKLWQNQKYFLERMEHLGFNQFHSTTPIIPLYVGDETKCTLLRNTLYENGIHIDSIMFPAVPIGKSRLRMILNSGHSKQQIDQFIDIIVKNQALLN